MLFLIDQGRTQWGGGRRKGAPCPGYLNKFCTIKKNNNNRTTYYVEINCLIELEYEEKDLRELSIA